MRGLAVLLAGLLLLLGAAYAAAPLYTYYELKTAARSGDAAQMSAAVDFASVRANLKTDLAARLAAAVNPDRRTSGPFAGQVAFIGQMVIDRIVDATVTAEGMGDMIRAAKAPGLETAGAPPASDSGAKVRTHLAYADFTHFRITFARGDKPSDRVGLLLEQKAPFIWKVTRIELPPAPAPSEDAAPSPPVTEATPIGEGAPTAAASDQGAVQPAAAQTAPPLSDQPASAAITAASPPPAPTPAPRPRHAGPPPGSDAYICAHGDPNSDFTIQACDRRTLGR
jgi:hypothetical protein